MKQIELVEPDLRVGGERFSASQETAQVLFREAVEAVRSHTRQAAGIASDDGNLIARAEVISLCQELNAAREAAGVLSELVPSDEAKEESRGG